MKKIKELFSTPKKAVITSVCMIAILVIVGACGIYAAESVAKSGSIGNEKAQYFAFADAGIDPAAAEMVRTEFDHEQGQFVYEVEFRHEGTEYEYWVRASDGSIVKKNTEIVSAAKAVNTSDVQNKSEAEQEDTQQTGVQQETEQKSTQQEAEQTGTQTETKQKDTKTDVAQTTAQEGMEQSDTQENTEQSESKKKNDNQNRSDSNNGDIGLEAAKTAALTDAGLTDSQVTFTKTKTDYDDGISIYEIEFYTDTHEYEYDIHAATGDIISKKAEIFRNKGGNSTGNSGNSNSYIGIDQAKSIAVEHAGFTVKDVTFSKAKLENDDGYTVYEVEFYKERAEYEYKIDALTGDILEYDAEQN